MHPCLCRPHGVFGMHRIRQRDVHRIDLVQAVLELIVREGVLESVAFAKFPPFRSVVAHDGNELRVSSSMCERGKDSDLGNVTKTNYGVSDGFMPSRWSLCTCATGALIGISWKFGPPNREICVSTYE